MVVALEWTYRWTRAWLLRRGVVMTYGLRTPARNKRTKQTHAGRSASRLDSSLLLRAFGACRVAVATHPRPHCATSLPASSLRVCAADSAALSGQIDRVKRLQSVRGADRVAQQVKRMGFRHAQRVQEATAFCKCMALCMRTHAKQLEARGKESLHSRWRSAVHVKVQETAAGW